MIVLLLLGLKKLHIQEQQKALLCFLIVLIIFMKGEMVPHFLVFLAPWLGHILQLYKATEEDLARIAVKNHENGFFNPKAHIRKKITVDDVLEFSSCCISIKTL